MEGGTADGFRTIISLISYYYYFVEHSILDVLSNHQGAIMYARNAAGRTYSWGSADRA